MKALVWIAKGIALLVAVIVGIWGISRLLPIPEAERNALRVLEQSPGFEGRNAFAAVWFLPYEAVPVDQYDALLAQDAAAQRAALDKHLAALQAGQENSTYSPPPSVAEGRWPATPAGDVDWCSLTDIDCLDKVRAAPDDYADAVTSYAGVLARVAALSQYDYLQSPLPSDVSAPLPPFQWLTRAHTAHAVAHVQGRSDEALAGLCNSVSTGRMLMSRSDSVIAAVIGARMIEGGTRLLSQVLAEFPADHALPAQCDAALALPAPDELSMCNAMRGEFRMASSVWPTLRRNGQLSSWLMLDEKKTIARNALPLAHTCSAQVAEAVARDTAVPPLTVSDYSPWTLRCAANAIGCVLSSIAGPAYDKYTGRLQDAGAQLRLLRIALWLREQPAGSDVPALLQTVPEPLRSPTRPVTLSADGRWLTMPVYGDGPLTQLQVALPAASQPAAAP
jgi:hypothetical protein